ncbi:uncharacterized protein LOC131624916 [Vicia villosa]|uniref:uncharacterized protein LOC131624916 n=1 Tax=Vicia villosa TaxID=3911 RepID=UPI00273C0ADC|nr:uncharacterized protein LOC131624916 [Vicia villosa]
MNPYDEQRLRDEVIYLHSLWHQGPPQQPIHSSSSSHLQPLLHRRPFAPYHTRSLPPVTTTAFKKTKNQKRKKKKEPKPDSLEWRGPQSSDSPQIGWPEPKPRSDPPPPLQPQEKERLSAVQAQNKACIALKEFLSGSGSGDEEDDNEEDHDDDDDDSDARLVEFEEFFIRVFIEDNELLEYYQRCFENGEFCCLVCGAGKKSGKKYKDCIGLVQHSISILRTANKKAHRAFGQAVCKVLGWDIHRLPTIAITAEPLRCSTEGKKSVAADDDGKDGSSQKEDIAVSLEHVADSVEEHVKETDQSIGDCSSKEGDAKGVDIAMENGEGGTKFEGDIKEKVVSAHDDEPVEDDERGVDQSNSEVIKL